MVQVSPGQPASVLYWAGSQGFAGETQDFEECPSEEVFRARWDWSQVSNDIHDLHKVGDMDNHQGLRKERTGSEKRMQMNLYQTLLQITGPGMVLGTCRWTETVITRVTWVVQVSQPGRGRSAFKCVHLTPEFTPFLLRSTIFVSGLWFWRVGNASSGFLCGC